MNAAKPVNFYPPLIALLLGGFLLFLAWSALQATGLGSKVTDADYYSKGLRYNTTLVEKRAATVLGWNLAARLGDRALDLHLTDRSGGAVARASGILYLAIPGRAENLRLPLREVAAGHYRVVLDPALHGSIQARLELERDGARLHRLLLLNL